jgi:hypothetical protein
MRYVENHVRVRDATCGNIIGRMHITNLITKATDTNSEYAVLIAFLWQQQLRERASRLRLYYLPCYILTLNIRVKRISLLLPFRTFTVSNLGPNVGSLDRCEVNFLGPFRKEWGSRPNSYLAFSIQYSLSLLILDAVVSEFTENATKFAAYKAMRTSVTMCEIREGKVTINV